MLYNVKNLKKELSWAKKAKSTVHIKSLSFLII